MNSDKSRKSSRISTRRPYNKYSSDEEGVGSPRNVQQQQKKRGAAARKSKPHQIMSASSTSIDKTMVSSLSKKISSPEPRHRGRPRKHRPIQPYRSSDEEEEEEVEERNFDMSPEELKKSDGEEFVKKDDNMDMERKKKRRVGRPSKVKNSEAPPKRPSGVARRRFNNEEEEQQQSFGGKIVQDEEAADYKHLESKYEEYEDEDGDADELDDREIDYVDDLYDDGNDFKLMAGGGSHRRNNESYQLAKNLHKKRGVGGSLQPYSAEGAEIYGGYHHSKQKKFSGSHFSKLLPNRKHGGPLAGYLFGQRSGYHDDDGVFISSDSYMDVGQSSHEQREPHACVQILESLLKLPKANKWILYEWFYSNLDRPLLLCDNEFRIVLRDSFPNLKTRRLTRSQWNLIRQIIGKPRRCSVAFFEEERRGLHEKRDKIRALQAKRNVDVDYLRDLPDDIHIPLPLIIGTKVNARIRDPIDAIFQGTVDALDNVNNFYRVTFERQAYATKSIPDYEVLSVEPHEVIPLSAFKTQHKASRNLFMSPARLLAGSGGSDRGSIKNETDDSISVKDTASIASGSVIGGASSSIKSASLAGLSSSASNMSSAAAVASVTSALLHGTSSKQNHPSAVAASSVVPNLASGVGSLLSHKLLLNESEIYGGYPMKFLVMVTRLSKILEVKKLCVEELNKYNTEVERKRSTNDIITPEFQTAYLTVIVQLERLNKELHQFMVHVLQYANEIAIEHGVEHILQTNEIRSRGIEEAANIIQKIKLQNGLRVRNNKSSALIRGLIGILVQLRTLSENRATDVEISSVHEALKELKQGLHTSNLSFFESTIEAPLEYVLSGMSNLGGLHSFHYSNPNHSHFI